MQTGIHGCQAVTEPTVQTCIKGDFENHSFKSPSLLRHSGNGALTVLCLIRHSAGTVDKGGPRMGAPRSISSLGFRRVSSPKPQPSGGISEAVLAKGREERKSGIDQNAFILLLPKRKTNIAED